jgi:putative tricarboxylic transport membrane protein
MLGYKDAVTGSVVAALGVALFILSFSVKDFASVSVGSEFLPRVAGVLFVVLGAILISQAVGAARAVPEAKPADPNTGKMGTGEEGGAKPVLLSVLVLCAYVAILQPVGFLISSALFIFLQIIVLSRGLKRNYLLFGVVSIVSSAVAYYLFVRVFQVMIPAGILG